MATTTDELKSIMEQHIATTTRSREADVEWRGRIGGTVERLTSEVQSVRADQRADRVRVEALERARVADVGSHADLEGRMIGKVASVEKVLSLQDVELDLVKTDVALVKAETRAQTPIIASTHAAVIGMLAQITLVKWAVPLTAAAIGAILSGAYWLFNQLHH